MSIIEIAKIADVSVSTVSRFFNKPETLSPQIAAKVEKAVSQTNYRMKALRPGPKTPERAKIRTGMIAFVALCDFSLEKIWQLPVMPVLLGSIQTTLLRRQLTLFIGNIDQHGRLPDCVTTKHCDGIILFSKPADSEIVTKVKKGLPDLPTVWCFREHADIERKFDHIFYDNAAVGRIAAEYLASHHHKKVALFNTDPAHTAFSMRQEEFCRCAESLHMKPVVFSVDVQEKPIRKTYRKLADNFLKAGNDITGAFFCVDHDMLGINIELITSGFPAGKLDMVGCNADETALQYIHPRPATVDIKTAQIGRMAVDQLLRRINNECDDAATEIFVKPELIKGDR